MHHRRLISLSISGLLCCGVLASVAVADMYVVSINGAVIRYDGSSGAFVETFVDSSTSGLSFPVDIKFGPDQNFYVSSSFNNRVMRYDGLTGDVIDVFVSDPMSTHLSFPQGITFGPDLNLYVASGARNTILQYDGLTGAFLLTFVGDNPGTLGIDESGGLSGPFGITFGPDGNLYVGSFDPPSKILQYDGTGQFLSTFVAGGTAGLNQPEGLTFGPDGNLYVANGGGQSVLRFDGASGAFIDTFVSQGSGGLITAVAAIFGPDGNLYVSSNTNSRVIRFDGSTGDFIDTFVPDGSGGLFAAQFLAFDAAVADMPPYFIGPSVSLSTVDGDCDGTLTFTATALDDYGISEFDIFVSVDLIGGAATTDFPNIMTTQVDGQTVLIQGSMHVYDITECPAIFQVTLFAFDSLGQLSDPAIDFGLVGDDIPPVLDVPADLTLTATPSPCQAVPPVPPQATATDNCTDPVPVTFERSDGQLDLSDPYACADSPVTITWIATDACGNTTTGTQLVYVEVGGSDCNLTVDVELSPTLTDPGAGPGDVVSRCLTFELWQCPTDVAPSAVVDQDVDFPADAGSPSRANAVAVPIPCGSYTCVTVRDRLHTLRSTAPDFTGDGTNYTATVVGSRGMGGHWLVQGNLNDDKYIDVWDFAYYINRFGVVLGDGDTDCSTPVPHADLDGDGMVFTSDFTFIAVNILQSREANCCGAEGLAGREANEGPALRLSVADLWRRGMGELASADLNGDGAIDFADVALFSMPAGGVGGPDAHKASASGRAAVPNTKR